MNCISCKTQHQGNFCPNCGERAGIPKITFQSIITAAFSTITNMDKGFLLNLKYLTLNPKHLVASYLRGRRKGIYNPIAFLILAITIYLVIDSLIHIPSAKVEINNSDNNPKIKEASLEAGRFLHANLKFFWILSIFWFGIATKLMFGKYNFAEHLAISSFVIGYATLFGLVGQLLFGWILIFNPFIYLIILVMIYRIFENKRDKFGSSVQAVLATLLFFIQLFLVTFLIGVLRVYIK